MTPENTSEAVTEKMLSDMQHRLDRLSRGGSEEDYGIDVSYLHPDGRFVNIITADRDVEDQLGCAREIVIETPPQLDSDTEFYFVTETTYRLGWYGTIEKYDDVSYEFQHPTGVPEDYQTPLELLHDQIGYLGAGHFAETMVEEDLSAAIGWLESEYGEDEDIQKVIQYFWKLEEQEKQLTGEEDWATELGLTKDSVDSDDFRMLTDLLCSLTDEHRQD